MIVLDASALVDAVLNTDLSQRVSWHLKRAGEIAAPDLIYAEAANALWRMVRAGEIADDQAETALGVAGRSGITAIPMRGLTAQAWQFRQHVRISDAFYLACADTLGAPVVTTDARLARGHHGVPVTLVT